MPARVRLRGRVDAPVPTRVQNTVFYIVIMNKHLQNLLLIFLVYFSFFFVFVVFERNPVYSIFLFFQ